MKEKKRYILALFSVFGMLLLILDTKTAITATGEGVNLCLTVLVPSLFPFILLSSMIGNILTGVRIPFLQPINRVCGIPEGAESLLLLGFTGGYPVGAKAICQAYENHQLDKKDAQRLLGFCSNAGPAFIFGMAGILFSSTWVPWLLWIVHILSAILTGCLLPGKRNTTCSIKQVASMGVPQALNQSLRTMASVCGWVVIFKVVLSFLNKWLLQYCTTELHVLMIGILELSNGFVSANNISSEGMRFLLCSVFLSFGGLCVGMQTVSVTQRLGTGLYFPGKLLQCLISMLLSVPVVLFMFQSGDISMNHLWLYSVAFLTAVVFYFYAIGRKRKKTVAFAE